MGLRECRVLDFGLGALRFGAVGLCVGFSMPLLRNLETISQSFPCHRDEFPGSGSRL